MSAAQQLLGMGYRLVCRQRLAILIYHQVLDQPDPIRPDVPDRAEFQWQMELIKRRFTPLGLAEAVQRLRQGTLPPGAVCVTFDDGYRDNLEVALPVLQQTGVPATVFVSTAFCQGENMWNDRVIDLVDQMPFETTDFGLVDCGSLALETIEQKRQACGTLLGKLKYQQPEQRLQKIEALYRHFGLAEAAPKMMSDNQVIELAEAGIEIGAHTVDHPILKVLSPEQQFQQMADSKAYLEQLIGRPVTGFAYPNGKPGVDYDQVTIDQLSRIGFDYAVSTAWGSNGPNQSHYELKRFTPWEKTPQGFQRRLCWNGLQSMLGR
ncbi:polysaccharide deacetylase family protein [Motiliproteus sp.]|uniref:polysaccharide deacetylase family protein n=1 Tax=Motiliproteus sp. TaxID=1898955 RepID=UPI003BAA5C6A